GERHGAGLHVLVQRVGHEPRLEPAGDRQLQPAEPQLDERERGRPPASEADAAGNGAHDDDGPERHARLRLHPYRPGAPEPPGHVRAGQIITYAIPISDRHVETHRVVRILRGGDHPVVITKGDANTAADPWKAELRGDKVWRYRFRLPSLGRAIVVLREPL